MAIIGKKYSNHSKALLDKVEEIDISINFGVIETNKKEKDINVLSLFSGCGGMDLGLEGGFTIHKDSISEKYNPDFIDNKIDNNFVRLKPTRFKLVFANDILR